MEYLWQRVRGDSEWTVAVREKYRNQCSWPGCTTPLQNCSAHHAIPRRFQSTRLIVDNGVYLCQTHHDYVEGLGRASEKYDRVMGLLLGKVWDWLKSYLVETEKLGTFSLLHPTRPDQPEEERKPLPSSRDNPRIL